EGLRNVAAGANPMTLKKGIEAAVDAAVASIKELAKEVDSKDQIAQVASISAADNEIGQMISEAIDKVGKDGVITVEESQTFGMEMDLVEGMRFDKGYISPYFATDMERMEASLRPVPAARLVEDLVGSRHAAGAREGHAGRSPVGDHRRRRRGRGSGHAGRQQDPWHVQVGSRQGSWLRRASQGNAARHRH